MYEIRILLLILALVAGLAWMRTWPPDVVFILVFGVIQLINLGMTVINCIQAHRRDPRFLQPGLLALVQTTTGALLYPFIHMKTASPLIAVAVAGPFVGGGILAALMTLYMKRGRE